VGTDEGLTVDELARATGATVRSVRALQSAGLLHPPTLRGRTGRYSKEHLQRLRAIHRLQAEGFSLAAVRALLAAWEEGRTLDEVLGLPARPRPPEIADGAGDDPFEAFAPFEGWSARSHPPLTVVPTTILVGPTDRHDPAACDRVDRADGLTPVARARAGDVAAS
jgi:DNA-binding transcriptional MerR regulator